MTPKHNEPYLSTYLHAKGRKLGLPIAGNFELTGRCNFSCPMCYVHTLEPDAARKELTADQWLEIACAARDRGMVFALLTGGEPLVRKDFFEIYRGMQALGLLVSINTNGSLLHGENLDRFLAEPPARFNISLYGGSNDTYSRMCGQPAYDRVRESIRALRKAGAEVCLNLTVTPENLEDVERIYADAVDLNVQIRAATYLYPPIRLNGGDYGRGHRLSPEDAAAAAVRWDKLRLTPEEFAGRVRAYQTLRLGPEGCPMDAEDGVRCRAGSTSFWMTWDGRMLPCGMMPGPVAYPLEVGFDRAWEHILQETAKIRMPAQCGSCAKKDVCGVCAAMCVTETGAFDRVPEYVCRMTDSKIQRMLAEGGNL